MLPTSVRSTLTPAEFTTPWKSLLASVSVVSPVSEFNVVTPATMTSAVWLIVPAVTLRASVIVTDVVGENVTMSLAPPTIIRSVFALRTRS